MPGFNAHIEEGIREHQAAWRDDALAEFRRHGGQPVSMPVETGNRDFSFTQDVDNNWFSAVGSTRSNVTGVVTVIPEENGQAKVGLDYQANAWDRYNWDESKGRTINLPWGSEIGVPDGQMARLHTTGIAQEFDMAGSSSVKHYDLGGPAPNQGSLPQPDQPGREGDRTDPGREQQEARQRITDGHLLPDRCRHPARAPPSCAGRSRRRCGSPRLRRHRYRCGVLGCR
ncbi:hypothetical protein ACWENA_09860 [Streptomyces sp. NPDC004779]